MEESVSTSTAESTEEAKKSPQSSSSGTVVSSDQPADKPHQQKPLPVKSQELALRDKAAPAEDEGNQSKQPRSALPIRLPGLHEALNKTPLDEERIQAHGIRKLSGKHLTLYTDLPALPMVEELVTVFDLAIPQWSAYFQIPQADVTDWHVIGRLMKDKTRFQKAGLLPESLPPFGHGFNYADHLWVYDQATDYYRRHLLLHEGTHAFMQKFLGGSGPAWYREGMAELLATHRWVEGKLQMKYFPRDRKETPGWGRIKIIKDEVAAGRGVMLTKVLKFPPTAHRQVQPYAWCWAATTFFENHPRYRARFHQLKTESTEESDLFSDRFYQRLQDQWPEIRDQWQWFVLNMEYGFDVQREAIDPKPIFPLKEETADVEIRVDRGWQSTGLQLAAGSQVEIVASGRYQIAADPEVWWCEPNGVTIHYYHKRPLGVLLAAVNGPNATGLTRLANIQTIGSAGTINTVQGGVLFLRINESGADLADNKGSCRVRIKQITQD
ncbi:MAG TPA: hypothetical protein EYN70_12475 [Planctomycetaceae bacterium]|nr:hypothetical protein [Planctomycetaceae bacterium]